VAPTILTMPATVFATAVLATAGVATAHLTGRSILSLQTSAWSARSRVVCSAAQVLEGCSVVRAEDGAVIDASTLVRPSPGKAARINAFFTHFGDFNSWEYAQQLMAYADAIDEAGCEVMTVGIGTQAAALRFSKLLGYPTDNLYADPSGHCHKALGFSQGAFPELDLPASFKLAAMLAGIGSPGTVQAVVQGYLGDPKADRAWVTQALRQGAAQGRFPSQLSEAAFNAIGQEGLRPFELATLRLQNMVGGILANWDDLAPEDPALTIQQGGTLVITSAGDEIYRFDDLGVLKYTPVDELLRVVQALGSAPKTAAP